MNIKKSSMFNTTASSVLYAMLSAGLLVTAPGALAQDEDATSSASVDEAANGEIVYGPIVVTARRREERLQDVPISVTAFSANDIQTTSVTNIKELGHFTPNVTINDHSQVGNTASLIYIRGIGQDDPGIIWEPGVGMYVDGIYSGRLVGIDVDLVEVERIEVLRGPQGTLFGRNTIGGAINVVSAKPDVDAGFSGAAELVTGRFDRFDGKLNLNVPVLPGKLAAKVGVASRQRDGYGRRLDFQTGETIGETGDRDATSGQLMLNWLPHDELSVLFSLDGSRVRESGAVRKLVATGQPPIIGLTNILADPDYGDVFLTDSNFTNFANGKDGANDLDVWGAGLTIEWNREDYFVKSITSYRDMEVLSSSDEDLSIYTIIHSDFNLEQDQFSQELQLGGQSFDGRLDWLTGLFYYEEDASTDVMIDAFELASIIIGNDLSLNLLEGAKAESYAVFGQGTYSFTDRFSLTAGLRYTKDEKEVSRSRSTINTGQVVVPFGVRSDSWDDVSGRLGLEYKWTDDVMTYVSVAKGYKSGGINGRSTSDVEFVPFDPETVLTYEAGVRSELLDNQLRLNATLFFNDYNDIQFLVTGNDPVTLENITFVDNAAKADVKGFELELVAAPTSRLNFSAGIGYTDAEYTQIDPGSVLTPDTRFVSTPEWSGVVSGQYAHPFDDGSQLLGRLDYTYQSETYYDIDNSPLLIQDGYGLLRARVEFESSDGKWVAALFGTNLTDEEYFTAGLDRAGQIGFAQVQFARPREWGASVRLRF